MREAVALLAPEKPRQEDFTKTVTETVTRRVGEGDNKRTITEVIEQTIPDVEAFRKAMKDAKEAIKEHNKEQRQAEQAVRRFRVIDGGRGEGEPSGVP